MKCGNRTSLMHFIFLKISCIECSIRGRFGTESLSHSSLELIDSLRWQKVLAVWQSSPGCELRLRRSSLTVLCPTGASLITLRAFTQSRQHPGSLAGGKRRLCHLLALRTNAENLHLGDRPYLSSRVACQGFVFNQLLMWEIKPYLRGALYFNRWTDCLVWQGLCFQSGWKLNFLRVRERCRARGHHDAWDLHTSWEEIPLFCFRLCLFHSLLIHYAHARFTQVHRWKQIKGNAYIVFKDEVAQTAWEVFPKASLANNGRKFYC